MLTELIQVDYHVYLVKQVVLSALQLLIVFSVLLEGSYTQMENVLLHVWMDTLILIMEINVLYVPPFAELAQIAILIALHVPNLTY